MYVQQVALEYGDFLIAILFNKFEYRKHKILQIIINEMSLSTCIFPLKNWFVSPVTRYIPVIMTAN